MAEAVIAQGLVDALEVEQAQIGEGVALVELLPEAGVGEDLAGTGLTHQAGGEIHGMAHGGVFPRLAGTGVAGYHLAAADPQRQKGLAGQRRQREFADLVQGSAFREGQAKEDDRQQALVGGVELVHQAVACVGQLFQVRDGGFARGGFDPFQAGEAKRRRADLRLGSGCGEPWVLEALPGGNRGGDVPGGRRRGKINIGQTPAALNAVKAVQADGVGRLFRKDVVQLEFGQGGQFAHRLAKEGVFVLERVGEDPPPELAPGNGEPHLQLEGPGAGGIGIVGGQPAPDGVHGRGHSGTFRVRKDGAESVSGKKAYEAAVTFDELDRFGEKVVQHGAQVLGALFAQGLKAGADAGEIRDVKEQGEGVERALRGSGSRLPQDELRNVA